MRNGMSDDTRTRILRVALREFSARGFHATSVREIADQIGVTKTAVLYHFPAKSDIVAALASPMLDDVDAAFDAVEAEAGGDGCATRWPAVEALLDVWLAHRHLLRMNLHDLAMAVPGPVFHRFRDGMLRANALIAGPAPTFPVLVRAAQSVAMLSDPVILFADFPAAQVRAAVLDGVRRLWDVGPPDGDRPNRAPETSGTAPARAPGRGRPKALTRAMADRARRMYDAGRPASAIAADLGVSRATVYRYVRRHR